MNYTANFLVIDDDLDDQEIFKEALKLSFPNAKCSYAFTCTQAIELLTSKAIAIPDYIFMDWNLPGTQGMVCVEQIRQVVGITSTKLFILTGGSPIPDPLLASPQLVNGILFKRASLAELAQEIATVIK
jgi:CheY-like chemotaxis protein